MGAAQIARSAFMTYMYDQQEKKPESSKSIAYEWVIWALNGGVSCSRAFVKSSYAVET